jgi:CRP-like cAMP-binding protein
MRRAPSSAYVERVLQRCPDCNAGDADIVLSHFRGVSVERGRHLLTPGEICEFQAFVSEGCLRAYAIDADGSEPILYFAPEGWWVTDVESFVWEQPASIGIDAIEPTELYVIHKREVRDLLTRSPACAAIVSALLIETSMALQRGLVARLQKRAAIRYASFLDLYPSLDLRIPQYQIAAYVGVSPEFLSKMRKRRRVHGDLELGQCAR